SRTPAAAARAPARPAERARVREGPGRRGCATLGPVQLVPLRKNAGAPPRDLRRFLPTTREEMRARGWDELDILIVNGDAYVDHPALGAALLGRFLEELGYRDGSNP